MYIPKWKYIPNWDNVIQIHPLQSIPPHPPWRADKCPIYVIKFPEPKYVLCPPKNAPRRAQKRETVSKHPRNAVSHVVDTYLQLPSNVIQSAPSQSIPSRPHWGAQKGGLAVINLYLPKYIFSPPKSAPIPPNCQNTVSKHPECCFPQC